jgi:hypothetical protein
MSLRPIDTSFDFKTEPNCRVDPDRRSPTLQRWQRLLFSKELPTGAMFLLSEKTSGMDRVLRYESESGSFDLSSDTMLNSNKGPLKTFYDQMPSETNLAWHRSSIGARILFPSTAVNGMTINQARGMHPAIKDRFDLTLEAIRRHYVGEASPLSDVMASYGGFFELFETFEGYVKFFLLDHLVGNNGSVRYYLPFDGYQTPPLPTTFDAYIDFRNAQLEFVAARNALIDAYRDDHLISALPA